MSYCICPRLTRWRNKHLSQAGRMTLLKSAFAPSPQHSMQVFCGLSSSLQVICIFISSHGIVCLNLRVIGFRRFGSINIAFVLKLGWFLLSDRNLIWLNLIRAKYLRGRKLLNVQNYPDNASWAVQGIWKVKQYLSRTVCYKIGFKSDLNIFQDPWIPVYRGFQTCCSNFLASHISESERFDVW